MAGNSTTAERNAVDTETMTEYLDDLSKHRSEGELARSDDSWEGVEPDPSE